MKIKQNKLGTLFVVIIFAGSTLGIVLISSGQQDNTQQTEMPAQNILSEPLTERQEGLILYNGGVIIDFKSAEGCVPCLEDGLRLEALTRQYSPYVFFIDNKNSNETRIILKGYKDEKELSRLNETEVEDFICDNIGVRLDKCIIREFE